MIFDTGDLWIFEPQFPSRDCAISWMEDGWKMKINRQYWDDLAVPAYLSIKAKSRIFGDSLFSCLYATFQTF